MRRIMLIGLVLALGLSALATTAARAQDDAETIMQKAHMNLYYAADDGLAKVQMSIVNKKGNVREREFIMLRKDFEEGGVQKYYVFFERPNDVRRTTFMAWKDPQGDDSRWIYVPALDLVKPISANDKKSSFVGSDFAYEDVSGRHWSEDTHKILREEELNGTATWVIESIPREKDYFDRKLTWVDKANLLPLREEYYGKDDQPDKVFEALEMKEVDGVLTITKRKMSTPKKENYTEIVFTDISYDVGVPEDVFSERYLKSPPREFIQE